MMNDLDEETPCPDCKGRAELLCEDCGGDTCPNCNWEGYKVCIWCDGEGVLGLPE